MNKKGQIQISFGMIFSIIIVIATVAVGFYVINYFLDMSSCTKTSLFLDSLTNEVDKAWTGDKTQTVFKGNLPSGITYVCFGNLSASSGGDAGTDKMLLELKDYGASDKNLFIYPPKKACEQAFYDLKHARFDNFFCVPVKSGEVNVKLLKTSTEALVSLNKP